jgi:hypothetical protein
MRSVLLPVCLALTLPIVGQPGGTPEKAKLTFTQDGKDLVVTTEVTANNSPHVLWSQAISGLGDKVFLRYYLIQNLDLLTPGVKKVKVEWRLTDQKKGAKKYEVQQIFQPTTAELKGMMPQLQQLIESGEKIAK